MEPTEIGAFEAKTRLSELLEQVRQGRVYRITKHGKVIAELRPVPTERKRPQRGAERGKIVMAEDFDAPLPEFEEYS